jgi:DNA processing protein
VFAIPGSVFEPSQEGCHELIRQNLAALVTSGDDIIDMMSWNEEKPRTIQPQLFHSLNEEEESLVDLIQALREPHIDELVSQSPSFTPSKMASILLGLELNGVIEVLPGKRYRLIAR